MRAAEADDAGDVERARAHAALLTAAVELRRQAHARVAGAHVQRADALRAVDLVRREREQIDAHRLDVDRDLAGALRRVGVEEDALLLGDLADLVRSAGSSPISLLACMIVIRIGLVGDRVPQLVEVDQAELVDGEIGDRRQALPLERLAGVEDGLVLGRRGDDVVALLLVELDDALDRQVVGLGGAAGEDDLLGLGADHLGDLLARLVDQRLGFPAEGVVAAAGVAELSR